MRKVKDRDIRLRIDRETREMWMRAARASGLSLSAWVRVRCNGMEITTAQAPSKAA